MFSRSRISLVACGIFLNLVGIVSIGQAAIIGDGSGFVYIDRTGGAVDGGTGGGEFRARESTYSSITGSGLDFMTFCLERTEFISPGSFYRVTVDDRAFRGSEASGSDMLSPQAQWLYAQYATGHLDDLIMDIPGGSDFTYSSVGWTQAIQQVFWTLEGETGGGMSADATRLLTFVNTVGTTSLNPLPGTTYVLNLWNRDATTAQIDAYRQAIIDGVANPTTTFSGQLYFQSQMIYLEPSGSQVVPEPASMAVWSGMGLAMIFVGWRKRRAIASPAQ